MTFANASNRDPEILSERSCDRLTVTVRNWSGQDFHVVCFVLVDFILEFLNLGTKFGDNPLVLTDVSVNVDEV